MSMQLLQHVYTSRTQFETVGKSPGLDAATLRELESRALKPLASGAKLAVRSELLPGGASATSVWLEAAPDVTGRLGNYLVWSFVGRPQTPWEANVLLVGLGLLRQIASWTPPAPPTVAELPEITSDGGAKVVPRVFANAGGPTAENARLTAAIVTAIAGRRGVVLPASATNAGELQRLAGLLACLPTAFARALSLSVFEGPTQGVTLEVNVGAQAAYPEPAVEAKAWIVATFGAESLNLEIIEAGSRLIESPTLPAIAVAAKWARRLLRLSAPMPLRDSPEGSDVAAPEDQREAHFRGFTQEEAAAWLPEAAELGREGVAEEPARALLMAILDALPAQDDRHRIADLRAVAISLETSSALYVPVSERLRGIASSAELPIELLTQVWSALPAAERAKRWREALSRRAPPAWPLTRDHLRQVAVTLDPSVWFDLGSELTSLRERLVELLVGSEPLPLRRAAALSTELLSLTPRLPGALLAGVIQRLGDRAEPRGAPELLATLLDHSRDGEALGPDGAETLARLVQTLLDPAAIRQVLVRRIPTGTPGLYRIARTLHASSPGANLGAVLAVGAALEGGEPPEMDDDGVGTGVRDAVLSLISRLPLHRSLPFAIAWCHSSEDILRTLIPAVAIWLRVPTELLEWMQARPSTAGGHLGRLLRRLDEARGGYEPDSGPRVQRSAWRSEGTAEVEPDRRGLNERDASAISSTAEQLLRGIGAAARKVGARDRAELFRAIERTVPPPVWERAQHHLAPTGERS